LRKLTINFVVSIFLSVRTGQMDSNWTNFREILYRVIQNDFLGFNTLSCTIHLRYEYVDALMYLEVYVPPLQLQQYTWSTNN